MTSDQTAYVQLQPDGQLPEISSFAPFKAVVVIEGNYAAEWQDQVSRWLVDSGCLYMLAWGPDCSSWDDSVDYAVITKYPEETPDDRFVMTTWHNDQTLEDVFWEAQFNARFSYNDAELANTLIIHISDVERKEWMEALFERSKTLAEREPD